MTDTSYATRRKADRAIGSFKLLIRIACLSLLVIPLNEWIIHSTLREHFEPWLWTCNAVMVVSYLAAGGFFMVWFYAVYKQLYVESPQDLRIPPAWTILGFSFPLANLFLPYLLVVKAWRRLKELKTQGADNFTVSAAHPPRYFKVWWFSHLVCFFAVPATYLVVLTRLQDRLGETAQSALSVFAYAMVCVSAIFAIRLVRELKSFD